MIIQGDCLQKLKELKDESVDMVMTSPPYWALRDYGVAGQLGLESTFQEYINKLCDIFDEVKRVLKKEGTCWVNMGDTYSGGVNNNDKKKVDGAKTIKPIKAVGVQDKCLLQIPSRFAIEMCNRGWILRNEIIWHKPNCMPSSVKDRFTVDFEKIFFFTKSKKYYFETQYEPYKDGSDVEYRKWLRENKEYDTKEPYKKNTPFSHKAGHKAWNNDPTLLRGKDAEIRVNPNGRNKRCVWPVSESPEFIYGQLAKKINDFKDAHPEIDTGWFDDLIDCVYADNYKSAVWSICTKPYKEAHFATYPEALCETPIKAGCPEFVCKKCGKAREKIYEKGELVSSGPNKMAIKPRGFAQNDMVIQDLPKDPYGDMPRREKKEVGYTDCGCNAGWEGGIVLDPFMGSGTTGVVCKKLNRNFIGIELSEEYCKIAEARIKSISNSLF